MSAFAERNTTATICSNARMNTALPNTIHLPGAFSPVITAEFATGMGSLIEAVNVLGSLFYGVILGIFLVAFYFKRIGSNAVFIAAILGECVVITFFLLDKYNVIGLGFLWLNVVGAVAVVLLAMFLQMFFKRNGNKNIVA
jgi:hypothetical protein